MHVRAQLEDSPVEQVWLWAGCPLFVLCSSDILEAHMHFPGLEGVLGSHRAWHEVSPWAFPAPKGSLSDHTVPAWFCLEGTLKILSSQALPWARTPCCPLGLPTLSGNNPSPASSLNPQMNSCSTRTSYLTPPAQRSPCTSKTAAELAFPGFVCLLTGSRDSGS